MAGAEGAIRIKRVGKFLLLGGLASFVLGTFAPILPPIPGLGFLLLGYLGILPMIAGGCLWVSGWILEGFIAPRGPDRLT
jgi:hypothetical protein